MNNWEKTQKAISRRFYGVIVGLLMGALITCVIYPVATQADADVVFLRTTMPSTPVIENDNSDAEQLDIPETIEIAEEIDHEQYLADTLMQDDLQVTYDKMENKERWQVVRMRTTGYCACPKCCGKFSDGKTASQHLIHRGDVFVAADKHYRFNTEMRIPGYNRAQPVKVLDRGRVIKGNRLDLYFDSHAQAQKWGVKYLDVLVKTNH